MDQDELLQMADLAAESASIVDGPATDNEMDLVTQPIAILDQTPTQDRRIQSVEEGSDIWLGAASEEETPRPLTRSRSRSRASRSASVASLTQQKTPRSASAASSQVRRTTRSVSAASSAPRVSPKLSSPPPQPYAEIMEEDAGFADLAPAPSDVSSADDPDPVERTGYRNDTIAQGEDFSMIFMDSIPALQASFRQSNSANVPPIAEAEEHEIGDETNEIINTTLESLRRSIRQESEADEDMDMIEFDEEEPTAPLMAVADPVLEPERIASQSRREAEAEDEAPVAGPAPESTAEIEEGTSAPPEVILYEEVGAPDPSSPFQEDPQVPKDPQPQPTEVLSHVRAFSPLLARSPRKLISPLRHQVLKSSAKKAQDPGFAERTDAELTPTQSSQRMASERFDQDQEDSNLYEDSFSEIPDVVLEAATPRRPNMFIPAPPSVEEVIEADVAEAMNEDEPDEIELVMDMLEAEPLAYADAQAVQEVVAAEVTDEAAMETVSAPIVAPVVASNVSVASQLDNGRLPTPDNTPPYIENESEDETGEKSTQVSRASSHMSSPLQISQQIVEVVSQSASHRAASQLPTLSIEAPILAPKVTPVNQLSSPLQESNSLAPEVQQIRSARPTLSPIVRAGRVLQSVTSDPPSPESRDRQLGSPFRSSASKDSRDSHAGRRVSMSPHRPFSLPAPRSSSVGPAPAAEDPFHTKSNSVRQTSFLQSLSRSFGSGAGHRRTISQESLVSSTRHAPPSKPMSWIAAEGPISPRLRGDVSLQEAAQSSVVEAEKPSPSPNPAGLDGSTLR